MFNPGAVVSVVVGQAIVPIVEVGATVFGRDGGAGDEENERTEEV